MATFEEARLQEYGELLDLGVSTEFLNTIERQHNVWPSRIMARVALFNRIFGYLTANLETTTAQGDFRVALCRIQQALCQHHQMLTAREEAHEDRMSKLMLCDLDLFFKGP
ncbi:hypothetical protein C1H76_4996 [Elsinoe australis]|uniref:Uncharacterized protein n=1 Tax=Elsinoe australis TaxID=40998 RepID=A0A4U7B1R7_9PEZI|nr:hypothetical protein C1H76_4996 [Elsinoe australis]